jgi:hypothetical protein
MLCPKCNQEIPNDTKVCPKCVIPISRHKTISYLSRISIILGLVSIFFIVLYVSMVFTIPAENYNIVSLIINIVPLIMGVLALIFGILSLLLYRRFKAYKYSAMYDLFGAFLGLISLTIWLFTPNVFIAGTRTNVSRVRGELRLISAGLEQYYVDQGSYPIPQIDQQGYSILPQGITTPISYITAIPKDPFSKNRNDPYRYFSGWYKINNVSYTFFIFSSNGPDKKPDLDVTTYTFTSDDTTWYIRYGIYHEYDPTNGAVSSGDIFRTGP